MKRTILIIMMILTLLSFCGCVTANRSSDDDEIATSQSSEDNSNVKTIEYYPDSEIPKLDSLIDANEITGRTEYPLYGPYETPQEASSAMKSYVSKLETDYGFTVTDDSVGYTLSNGTDEITIMGGNIDGKFAIGILVN